MNIWQSVKVKTEDHARFGQAGVIFGTTEDKDTTVVRFDSDNAVEVIAVADLQTL